MASRLQDAIQRGLRSAQPLATAVSAGTLYYVTDELVTERSSGSAWQTYSDAGAVPTAITQLTGDVTAGPGPGSVAATIANNAVSNAKLRDSAALSVIGRSVNSGGDPADIAATPATDAVLRESGSTVGFGTVVAGGIAADAVITAKILDKNVTYAKIQDVTNARLLGNFTGGAAAPAEYSLGAGLEHSAGAIRTKVDIRTELHGVTVDGGGALVTTGSKGWFRFPVAGTITAWNLMADAAGNLDFDVSQDATYPATTSVLTPSLSGVAQNSATGLTIPVTAGDYFDFAITGTPTVITKAVLQLTFVVTG